jgi:hypothetical protein
MINMDEMETGWDLGGSCRGGSPGASTKQKQNPQILLRRFSKITKNQFVSFVIIYQKKKRIFIT